MPTATAKVILKIENQKVKVHDTHGQIPWAEVLEECSFYNAELSKELYPDAVKAVQTSVTKVSIPPIRLIDQETREFPIGLLTRFKRVMEENGVEVEELDATLVPQSGFNFQWKGPIPYKHQEDALETALSSRRYGFIVSPTGSGKTLLCSKMIQKLGVRTLWVVHSVDLVRQTAEFLKKYLGISAGEVGGGRNKVGTVTVSMAGNSLKKAMAAIRARDWTIGLLVVDEAHRAAAYRTYEILKNIDAYYRYGLTATPFRSGGDELLLEALFGDTVAQVSLSELQDAGLVSKVRVETITIPIEEKIKIEGATWEEVYKPGIVEHKGRNNRIVQKIKELVASGRQVLVDVDEIDHLDHLNLKKHVELVEEVTGSVPVAEREKIYNDFREGRIKVLAGTVLREGIDLPVASAVVLAGGKKSKVKVLQEIGRGLRILEGKQDCIVVDTIDQQHFLLFQHCQQRFKTMISAGFYVPEEAIRTVQIEAGTDNDIQIAKLRERQLISKTKRQAKTGKTNPTNLSEEEMYVL